MSKDKISLQELAELISAKANVSRHVADEFVKALFAVIEEVLFANNTLKINGLGTFKLSWNEPRRSVNINTGEEFTIEGYNRVVFAPDTNLKNAVNEPFAHLQAVVLDELQENVQNETEILEPLKTLEIQADEINDILSEIKNMGKAEVEAEIKEEVTEIQGVIVVNKVAENAEIVETEKIVEPENQSKVTEFTYETTVPERRKRAWWITLLIIVALIAGLKITYFSSSCIQCWVKYDLLDEPVRSKITSMENFVNQQFDNFKDFFVNDEIQVESKKSLLPSETQTDSIQNPISAADSTENQLNQPRIYEEFLATETMLKGTRLTLLSKKYYGHKDFWVYIYEANRDKYLNPDLIPIGAEIKIPALDKNLIDAENPINLLKARELHDVYVRRK